MAWHWHRHGHEYMERPESLHCHHAGRVSKGDRYVYIMGHDLGVGHLVAHAHVGPRPAVADMCLNHRNNDPADDRAVNLRWSAESEAHKGKRVKPLYMLAASDAARFSANTRLCRRPRMTWVWRLGQ